MISNYQFKRLFVFAHKGEAQTFIKEMQMKLSETSSPLAKKGQLYQNRKDYLLISGEGSYQTILNLSHLFTTLPEIDEIYNFGIAGLLNLKGKINQIYPINICYGYRETDFNYQSFPTNISNKIFTKISSKTLNQKSLSCISSDKRIKNHNTAKKLSVIADLVDREIWAIGYTCHFFKKRFYSYKIISDIANESTNCFNIKNKAKFFSDKLYHYALENAILEEPLKQKKSQAKLSIEEFLKIINKYFHISYYQKKKILHLLDLIVIDKKLKWDEEELVVIINSLFSNQKEQENKMDKKKMNLFISKIDKEINPYKKKVIEKITKITKGLVSKKINLKIDENYQKDEIHFHFKVNNSKDYQTKIAQLKKLNIKKIYQILNGE